MTSINQISEALSNEDRISHDREAIKKSIDEFKKAKEQAKREEAERARKAAEL